MILNPALHQAIVTELAPFRCKTAKFFEASELIYRHWAEDTLRYCLLLNGCTDADSVIALTKTYVLSGGQYVTSRIGEISAQAKTNSLYDEQEHEFFFAMLVGAFEALNFLSAIPESELFPRCGVDSGLGKREKLENAAEALLVDALSHHHGKWADWQPNLSSQKIPVRFAQALKKYFTHNTDGSIRDRRRKSTESLLKRFLAPLQDEPFLHPVIEFIMRELFYCRIYGLSMKEIAMVTALLS